MAKGTTATGDLAVLTPFTAGQEKQEGEVRSSSHRSLLVLQSTIICAYLLCLLPSLDTGSF